MESGLHQGTKMVPAICPQCGAGLNVDSEREKAFCQYCGTEFIVDQAVNTYKVQHANVEHIDTVNVNKKGAVESALDFIEHQQQRADEARKRRAEEQKIEEEKDRIRREKMGAFFKKYWWATAALVVVVVVFFSVEIKNEQGGEKATAVNYASSDLEEMNYKDAVDILKKDGFTDIVTEAENDLIVGVLSHDGAVDEVSINGYSTYSSDSKFPYDAKIIVKYHCFPPTASEAPSTQAEPTAGAA